MRFCIVTELAQIEPRSAPARTHSESHVRLEYLDCASNLSILKYKFLQLVKYAHMYIARLFARTCMIDQIDVMHAACK